ncbi:unnamed protein product [Caenorhabditis brenneri]
MLWKNSMRKPESAEVPQLQHENKLLAETLAALKKEKQAKEDEFTERNSVLNNKLNTALAKNEELRKKVEDLEGTVEELEEQKKKLVEDKDMQIAELEEL